MIMKMLDFPKFLLDLEDFVSGMSFVFFAGKYLPLSMRFLYRKSLFKKCF